MKENLIPINNKCPVCNADLIDISDDNIVGVQCSKCDYGYVSDKIHDWQEDEIQYSIYFIKDDNPLFDTMKFISKKLQIGIVKTKELLNKNDVFYTKGQAWQLKDIIKELNYNNINYKIKPKFKYKF